MKKDIREKLLKAKVGLVEALVYNNSNEFQKRIYFALETIDDAIEGKIRFPGKSSLDYFVE